MEQQPPYWKAPELLKHGIPSTATDIYAFGLLMYEMLYRREPFAGESSEVCCTRAASVQKSM